MSNAIKYRDVGDTAVATQASSIEKGADEANSSIHIDNVSVEVKYTRAATSMGKLRREYTGVVSGMDVATSARGDGYIDICLVDKHIECISIVENPPISGGRTYGAAVVARRTRLDTQDSTVSIPNTCPHRTPHTAIRAAIVHNHPYNPKASHPLPPPPTNLCLVRDGCRQPIPNRPLSIDLFTKNPWHVIEVIEHVDRR